MLIYIAKEDKINSDKINVLPIRMLIRLNIGLIVSLSTRLVLAIAYKMLLMPYKALSIQMME